GAETTEGSQKQIYAKRGDQPTVYALGDWTFRTLAKPPSQFRDKTVLGFDPTRVGKLAFERKDGGAVRLARGECKWTLEGDEAEEGGDWRGAAPHPPARVAAGTSGAATRVRVARAGAVARRRQRRASSRSAASSRSISASVPTVMRSASRSPGTAKWRTRMSRAASARATGPRSTPGRRARTKFASDGGTRKPRRSSSALSRARVALMRA